MAYILFGGSPADFTVVPTTVPASAGGTTQALTLDGDAPLEAWTAGASGSQVTDLKLFTGSYTTEGAAAPSGIFSSQVDGTVLVWAQDTVTQLWVTGQGSTGQRWLLAPVNLADRVKTIESASYIPSSQKGAALGVASLGSDGKVPSAQLPASVASGVVDITTPVGGTESGNVTLTAADLAAVPTSRTITPGTGLTGGGDLSANRTISPVFGTTAGTIAQGNDPRFGTTGTSPRPVYAVVLSNDAPADRKAAAASDPYTWVCDGTNDEVQINAAIDAASPLQSRNAGMPAGAAHLGKVVLSGGRFNIGSGGIVMRTAVHLEGAGLAATELRAVSCNQTGLIRLGSNTDHLCHVSDLYMHGMSGSGGTCSAIHFNMTGGANTSLYPDSNPDSDHLFENLYIFGFDANTSRHGIYLQGGSGDHNRGNQIKNCQIRSNYTNPGGTGVWLNGSSDSYVAECHIGGYNIGYDIGGGNSKLSANKSFYSNVYGVRITSGRALVSGHESQDDDTGIFLDGVPATCTGLVIDTSNAAGLRVSNDRIQAVGFNIFNRGGGRYATTQRGIWYDNAVAFTNCCIIGNVENSAITTSISGPPATGTNLVTVS
jgi:hypothetical protein